MKQYSINARVNGCEAKVGSVLGNSHKVEEFNTTSRFLKIYKDNCIIYNCLCDDIEIVEENDRFDVYIYQSVFTY